MSRFGDARWQRLAVWTGAALAWGSTLTAWALEPSRGGASTPETPESSSIDSSTGSEIPTLPGKGILVVRFQPAPTQEDAPQTVTVVRAAQPQTAPQPTSSGS